LVKTHNVLVKIFAWFDPLTPLMRIFASFVIGALAVIPVCLLSFPLTLRLATWLWPGDGQSPLGAIGISVYLGFGAGILTCAVLLFRSMIISGRSGT
jgi:hypothetical protein